MESMDKSGQSLKCPTCGAEFPRITSICPGCGHIFDRVKVSPSLKAFMGELEEYDKLIVKEKKTLRLTAAERRKTILIQNFSFASDRRTILETLLFVKSQMKFLERQKRNWKTNYWVRIWTVRAEQLYEKAQILFPETNHIIEEAHIYIVKINRQIISAEKRRAIAGSGVILAAVVVALLSVLVKSNSIKPEETKAIMQSETVSSAKSRPDKTKDVNEAMSPEKDEDTFRTLTIENFSMIIPDYWDEEGSSTEYLQFYGETGGKVAMLSISYPVDDDEVTLDALYADNDNMITAIEGFFSECKVTKYENFQSGYGVAGVLYSYEFKMEISEVEYEGTGKMLCFPSVKDQRWFLLNLSNSNNVERDYEDDFMETLMSIKEVP